LYDLLGALAFPLDSTSSPLSLTATSRLMARLAVTITAALGAALAVHEPRASTGPAPLTPGTL
jgi:hypothetical protein